MIQQDSIIINEAWVIVLNDNKHSSFNNDVIAAKLNIVLWPFNRVIIQVSRTKVGVHSIAVYLYSRLKVIVMPTTYERVKHLVEVHENVLAVFILDSNGNIPELFIAKDVKNINYSAVEAIRDSLNLRFENDKPSTFGKHLWDISQYDKIRLFKIYERDHLIVVVAKSDAELGQIAETILGYLYDSEEDSPKSLF